eukprot:snap_masked-scaffold_7-processed-gene-16.16-mRNA-1 protein AED:1.00 eAED:1.00 QI:0/-1/0/0/-1/1/1/0/659
MSTTNSEEIKTPSLKTLSIPDTVRTPVPEIYNYDSFGESPISVALSETEKKSSAGRKSLVSSITTRRSFFAPKLHKITLNRLKRHNGKSILVGGDAQSYNVLKIFDEKRPGSLRPDLDFIPSFINFFNSLKDFGASEMKYSFVENGSFKANNELYFMICSFLHISDTLNGTHMKTQQAQAKKKKDPSKRLPKTDNLSRGYTRNIARLTYIHNRRRKYRIKKIVKKKVGRTDLYRGQVEAFKYLPLDKLRTFRQLESKFRKGLVSNLEDLLLSLLASERYTLSNFADVFRRLLRTLRRPLFHDAEIKHLISAFHQYPTYKKLRDVVDNFSYPSNFYFLKIIQFFRGLQPSNVEVELLSTVLAPSLFRIQSETRAREIMFSIASKIGVLKILIAPRFDLNVGFTKRYKLNGGKYKGQVIRIPDVITFSAKMVLEDISYFGGQVVWPDDSSKSESSEKSQNLEAQIKIMLQYPKKLSFPVWDSFTAIEVLLETLNALPLALKPLVSTKALLNLCLIYNAHNVKKAFGLEKHSLLIKFFFEELSPSNFTTTYDNLAQKRFGVLSFFLNLFSRILNAVSEPQPVMKKLTNYFSNSLFFPSFEKVQNQLIGKDGKAITADELFIFLWYQHNKFQQKLVKKEGSLKDVTIFKKRLFNQKKYQSSAG